jgi:uncharacterized membrane protein (Fun14 family)
MHIHCNFSVDSFISFFGTHAMSYFTTVLRFIPLGLTTSVATASALLPDHEPTAPAATSAAAIFNSSFFLTLGFSFMIGLAMGFALKIAFKIALLIIGIIVLGLFGLQYAGLVDVNWIGLEGQYDGWAAWLSAAGGSFLDFASNHLSGGASFLAGLALGLKF